MADGFKAINTDGVFQIDGETLNFQLVNRQEGTTTQQGLATVTNDVGSQYYVTFWAITFTFTANTPLVAFRAQDGVRITPWKFARSGNTYTATFITDAQADVIMWVFDQSTATADNYGLKVYNSAGQLVCSAIQPFAKVVDVQAGQYFPGTGWYASGGQMPGDNPVSKGYGYPIAFGACFPAHYMESSGSSQTGTGSTNMSGLMTLSGATAIQWDFHTYAGSRSGNFVGFRESTAYRFLVLDMTGIP